MLRAVIGKYALHVLGLGDEDEIAQENDNAQHALNEAARERRMQPAVKNAAKTMLNCGGIMKKWGILPSFLTSLRHFSALVCLRNDLLRARKPIQDASAQDAAPLFHLFGTGN